MRRWIDILVLGAVVTVLLAEGAGRDAPPLETAAAELQPRSSVRRPLPFEPPDDRLPPPSDRDPPHRMDVGPKRSASGTAFSVGAGVWMTARHVADDCTELGIETEPRFLAPGRDLMLHANADLALFRASVNAAPVVAGGHDLRIGQDGYHLGFPLGEFGALRSRLLGRGTVSISGRFSARAPILVWAEVDRVPERDGPNSGMSGGPVFDAAGKLVGVSIGSSLRRGRVTTAAPESMRELWRGYPVAPADAHGAVPPLDHATFGAVSRRLWTDLIVTRVVCRIR